jgi:hypothetical protein
MWRIFALLVIAACTIKCGGTKEAIVINVAPSPNYAPSSYSHRLTAAEEQEIKHPTPISPSDAYLSDWHWWEKR